MIKSKKKHLLGYIKNVGANIVRPPTWCSKAFSGKALHIARGHGRAMLAPTEFYNGRMIYKQ